jgi:phosphoribosylaminoimidazolecarboxamide formyltransferase/IMP cyclohydrolase
VASVTDPADYDGVIRELEAGKGVLSLKTRFSLAQKAFAHTAAYDTAIAAYLKDKSLDTIKACYQF